MPHVSPQPSRPVRVLFVCLGNICRSPMAEYVLRHRAREAGMGNAVITASAGTSGWHDGENMHEGTRRALKQHGIDPSGFTSSKIKPSDAEHFDYIIVMDDNNLRETEKQLGFHPRQNLQTDRPYSRFRLQPRSRSVVHRRL